MEQENQNQEMTKSENQLADLESVLGPMSMMEARLEGDFLSSIIDIDIDIETPLDSQALAQEIQEEKQEEKKLH